MKPRTEPQPIDPRPHFQNSPFCIPHSSFFDAPWPDPVPGATLLDDLVRTIRRFVVLPPSAAETLALWILHTHAFELGDVSAYLGIESPEKRCGKTTLLSVLSELVNRPVVAANISSPAFFRVIEETRPTLLIDEADTFLRGNDELRGILNSGYRRQTAYVVRVTNQASENVGQASRLPVGLTPDPIASDLDKDVGNAFAGSRQGSEPAEKVGQASRLPVARTQNPNAPDSTTTDDNPDSSPSPRDEGVGRRPGRGASPFSDSGFWIQNSSSARSSLARFSCWCPKAIAAIGRLPETLADRCIVIRMQRKTDQEQCERLRHLDTATLRRQCARFVLDHAPAIAEARPQLPAELHDRAGDIWEPLLVLADLAGGPWPARARQAAVTLSVGPQESNPIASLLVDILPVLYNQPDGCAATGQIIDWLNHRQDRPWSELRSGRLVNQHWLAQQLRPYGIRPRPFWREGRQSRGYRREDFREIAHRYISKADLTALMPEPPPSPPDLNRNLNPNLDPNSPSEVGRVSPQRAAPNSPPTQSAPATEPTSTQPVPPPSPEPNITAPATEPISEP